ncbi:hypothetical protein BC939DRAFT_467779 [Gamsiella multidivaricata]|uniref:uncharacterized protein n=1 Tax=Gamsiella multidivaricata TaxID=101098 RepID=UPI00222031FC|nr:uncharacterized protein BC939DRAFT_467779 [Gamsiella multidivaricata]KAI7816810.1 hypothetical protein BC939DRAFT_467779 [Gamsiella multidivaricata]
MQKDCWAECEFAKYTEAMQMIPKVMDYSGCDQWVDLKTIAELNKPGFPKPDLGHKSVVHEYVEEEKSSRSFGGALKQKLEETYVSKEEKDLGENCEGNKYRKSHEDENEKEGKAKQGDAVATRSRGVKDDL